MANIDPSKREDWVRVLPELPPNLKFKNASESPEPTRRGVPPTFGPRQPSQHAQVETSFGQPPIRNPLIDPSKKPNWVRVLPELPANFRFKNTSEPPEPSRRGVPPKFSPRKPSQPAQFETSLGQEPICDSECINCQREPEVHPSRGERPPLPPKPAILNVQPQAAVGGFDYNRELGDPPKVKKVPPPVAPKPSRFRQPAPQPANILLPPFPSQSGMLRPPVPSQPGMPRPPVPSQPGMLRPPFPSQPGMLRPPVPSQPGTLRTPVPSQPGMPRPPIPPQSRMMRPPFPQEDVFSQPAPNRPLSFPSPPTPRAGAQPQPVPVFSDDISDVFSPRTPDEEQYTEYMRSRPPSQGDGELTFMEPADMRPGRSRYRPTLEPMTPATDLYTKYSRRLVVASPAPELRYQSPHWEPKHRPRLYGTSDSIKLQEPSRVYTGPFFPDTPSDEKEYNELYNEYMEYVRSHPPFSPHTPPREEEFTEYMRSRAPSQGDGEMEPTAEPPKRRKKAYGSTSRRVIAIPPPVQPGFDRVPFSPHTPPREEEEYTEYMRSRIPSQGDDEVSFVEPADVPPILRRRLYAISDSGGSRPLTDPQSHYNLFGKARIHNVTSHNFDEVMQSMEKAFVMFYDPTSESSICAGKEIAKASGKSHPSNHAFAAVDCTQEQELCAREDATRLPIFKLYSNGFDLSTIRHATHFCAKQIQMLMKMTPVLTQPRTNLTPGYMQSR